MSTLISSIVNPLWGITSHPFLHYPSVQGVSVGTALCRYGIDRCSQATKAETTGSRRVFNAALGSLAMGAGAYMTYWGAQILWNIGIAGIQRSFFAPETAPLYDGFYRLSSPDPSKQSLLWLNGYNVGANPFTEYGTTNGFDLKQVFNYLDVDIRHPLSLCKQIQSFIKNDDSPTVVINTHANWSGISLSETHKIRILRDTLPGCFDGMSDKARIILGGCMAGSRIPFLNIAEWMSWISGKIVYASTDYVSNEATSIWWENEKLDIDFCHPDEWAYEINEKCSQSMMRVFYPPKTLDEKALMIGKIGLSALTGLFCAVQQARLAALGLNLSGRLMGTANEWISPAIKRAATLTGLYNETVGSTIYGTVKISSKLLEKTGSCINQVIDGIEGFCFDQVSKAGSYLWEKITDAPSHLFSYFCPTIALC